MARRQNDRRRAMDDFLADFRVSARPAVDTHPFRSSLIIGLCAVLVLALCGAGVAAIAAHHADYEKAAWLAGLRGRTAFFAHDRAIVSGGWPFALSSVRPCAALGEDPVPGPGASRPARRVVPRLRAAARTCKESLTASQAWSWISRQQRSLTGMNSAGDAASASAGVPTGAAAGPSGADAASAYDSRTVTEPVSVPVTFPQKRQRRQKQTKILRGYFVSSASPRILHSRDDARGRRPLIVCASGLGVTMGYCRWLVADIAAPLGWSTLVFDPSGIAANAVSDGSMQDMSVMSEERDLEQMVRYARSRPWVDPGRLVLVGQSQGGLASVLLAARHPGWVWRLALDYPALNIPNIVRYVFPARGLVPDGVGLMGFRLGRPYATDVWDLRPWRVASQVRAPTLIEQGTADAAVDASVSYRTVGTMPDARLVLIPGEKHNFGGYGRLTSAARLMAFLQKAAD